MSGSASQLLGSLVVVITLCAVHATIAHWRILRGPGKQVWLSLSAGAALAYVFTYLLPKLARIEDKILETESIIGPRVFSNHAYLLALIGLVAAIPRPEFASYALVTAVLGLHLMGVDHGVFEREPVAYQRILRWVYVAATLAGWTVGSLTTEFEKLILFISTFIAGGILITAIRDELPSHEAGRAGVFVLSIIATTLAILAVQHWQTV